MHAHAHCAATLHPVRVLPTLALALALLAAQAIVLRIFDAVTESWGIEPAPGGGCSGSS